MNFISNTGLPLPTLTWNFNGTTTDNMKGLTPNTVWGNPTSYGSGKYLQDAVFNTTPGSTTSGLRYDIGSYNLNTFSIALWVKPLSTIPVASGNQRFLYFSDVTGTNFFWIGFNANTTTPNFYGQNPSGGTPLQTVGLNAVTPTLVQNQWVHLAWVVYSNGQYAVYVNGVSYAVNPSSLYSSQGVSGNPFTSINPLKYIDIAVQNGFNAAFCEIDDVRVYNTALSSSQMQGIYSAQGILNMVNQFTYNSQQLQLSTVSGTSLFNNLSKSAVSSIVGAYSLRAVNGTTAKSVRVKRSSDNATQDFYADRLGNLLTAPITGTHLTNWLGGSTGYVITWYDQSGSNNNATGSGSIIYASSNVNMKWSIQSGSLLTVSASFLTNSNFTIHSITRRTQSSQAPGGGGTAPINQSIYSYTPGTGWNGTPAYNRFTVLYNYQGERLSFNSVNTSLNQYTVISNTGCGYYSSTGPVDYLSITWNGTTMQMYYNGSTSASTAAGTFGNIPNTNNFYLLGCPAYGSIPGGDFGEIIVFNSVLNTTDIATLYSSR